MTLTTTRENDLNNALLISNFFLIEICDQLEVDLDTAMRITLRKRDTESVVKEYSIYECLEQNKKLLVKEQEND